MILVKVACLCSLAINFNKLKTPKSTKWIGVFYIIKNSYSTSKYSFKYTGIPSSEKPSITISNVPILSEV